MFFILLAFATSNFNTLKIPMGVSYANLSKVCLKAPLE